jgi:cell division protein FtsA
VRAGFEDKCAAGVVITGGTALLPGIEELGEVVFEMPARVGRPLGVGGLTDVVNSPMFATGVGLVIYGSKNQGRKQFRVRDRNVIHRVWERMREGVEAFF